MQAEREDLFTYPVPAVVNESLDYSVTVNGKKVFVERVSKYDVPLSYTHFSFSGKAKINIRVNEKVLSCSVSPKSRNIPSQIKEDNISFSIFEPTYLVVKINFLEYLFILADPAESSAPKPGDANVKNIMDYGVDNTGRTSETFRIQQAIDDVSKIPGIDVLYFGAGTYLTGSINMRNNVTVYLEGGALLKASDNPADYVESEEELYEECRSAFIFFDGISNAGITGRGVVDGNGRLLRSSGKKANLLRINRCSNIRVEGIILRDPSFWNTHIFKSEKILLKNIKVINNRPVKGWTNTDGINPDCSKDVVIDNAFMHCGDDCFAVKGTVASTAFGGHSGNISIKNAVCINNSVAAKVGTETMIDIMENIEFSNFDVIQCTRGMVVDCFDYSTVLCVKFKNFSIENMVEDGPESPKVFDIMITDKSWRNGAGKGHICDVSAEDIKVDVMEPSSIAGMNDIHKVENVAITRFNMAGYPVSNTTEGKIETNKFVDNLTIKI